jgi:hypothetical protein
VTHRHVLRAPVARVIGLGSLLLFCLAVGVACLPRAAAAAEDAVAGPPEPSLGAAAAAPGHVQAHVLMPEDFAHAWTPAQRSAAWNAGLPVPEIVHTEHVFAQQGQASTGIPPRQSIGRLWLPQLWGPQQPVFAEQGSDALPWQTVFRYSLRGEFAGGDAASCRLLAIAPEVQFACVLRGFAAAQNMMVQVGLRAAGARPGESLFVGVSTDGTTFYGRRWRAPAEPGRTLPESIQRIFVPFVGDHLGADGRVAVLWAFGGSRLLHHRPTAWLENIMVDRYLPGPATRGCSVVDPVLTLEDAPGRMPVSKGLNLPPYPILTPGGLWGHVARLRQSGVQWVRVEWQARLSLGNAGSVADGSLGRAALLNYIDLRHYDELLALLCAPPQPIGVLGLLDYWTLPDQRWQENGRIDDDYLAAFGAMTKLLARYYGDRVGAWEIWNEPDFAATHLAAGDYARLLADLHAAVKQGSRRALVVFGGLGGADWVAANYFREVVRHLPPGQVPYDVFAIHPYPSHEFRRGGRIIRDPSYLYAATPTILEPFLEIMREAGHAPRPVWVTELGWNRAADSANPQTLECQAVYETMVTGVEQAAYLPQQFDILFKQVEWEPGVRAVAKIFWYQYMDVGLALDDAACRGRRAAGGAPQVVDWWFGLYSGTDGAAGVLEPQPNLVECSFRAYPHADELAACQGAAHLAANPPASGP